MKKSYVFPHSFTSVAALTMLCGTLTLSPMPVLSAAPAAKPPPAKRPAAQAKADPAGGPVVKTLVNAKIEAENAILAPFAKVLEDSSVSGGKYVCNAVSGKNEQTPLLEFKFQNLRYDLLEIYLLLKADGGGKIRFYYEFDDKLRYPVDIEADGKWQLRQIACHSFRQGPHYLKIYSDNPKLVFDAIVFENSNTDELPAGNNLRILPPVKRNSRIVVRDINYVPEKIGDAIVCLWKNDAIGTATYTVDDNHANEIPWWLEQADKYGAKITWFVISDRIGKGHPVAGSWEDYRKVLEKGHDVQSHTYTHLHAMDMPIDEEYSTAVDVIEKNLPGHKILAVAYAGGKYTRKNSPDVSARYHIASRGAGGAVNEAGKTNYMTTNSFHGSMTIDPDNRLGLMNMVKLNPKFKRNYRAWNCHHFHNVPTEKLKSLVTGSMAFYQKNKVWMPTFIEAVKYGQERDSATLKTIKNSADEIVLSLTDKMDDSIFDYPLTLRLRIPDDWQAASVEQDGKKIEVNSIVINGMKTLMFDAVPDRGEITVKKIR